MSQEAINRAAREAKRTRKLGPDAKCLNCAWRETQALCRTNDDVRCYECRQASKGKTTIEAHHHFGAAIDPATIAIPGNVHRVLSDRQFDWPKELRMNPQRDPLLWLAAGMRGLHDHLAWWLEHLLGIAEFVTACSAALTSKIGTSWWTELGLPSPDGIT